MKRIACLTTAAAAMTGGILYMASALGQTDEDASPIYGLKIPAGYREWRLISVKQLAGNQLKQLRAQLGNDIAIEAVRKGTLPFPDGAIIAVLHWNEASSDLDNQVLAAGFPGAGLASVFACSAVKRPIHDQALKKISRLHERQTRRSGAA
jgi:hypothetical protein